MTDLDEAQQTPKFASVANVLKAHTDEVWTLAWSHSGAYLASASRDKTAIVWHLAVDPASQVPVWTPHLTLGCHLYCVSCLAWSPDDAFLITASEHILNMWDTQTGECVRSLEHHTETVTAIQWLPDGSRFITTGLDRKIVVWGSDGDVQDSFDHLTIRVAGLKVTPDAARLVVIGTETVPNSSPSATLDSHKMLVLDLATKQMIREWDFQEKSPVSIQLSKDAQFALINCDSDQVHLWNLDTGRRVRTYTGHKNVRHVIRSAFSGKDEEYVVSGSEDGNVYIWNRDNTSLLDVLSGHGTGSVNDIAWHPTEEGTFASCSDDHTVHIWKMYEPVSPVGEPWLVVENEEEEFDMLADA
ncbi:WD40-repeat-containing domain protein [Crassisporium funariophilum]|nr:WD40-repeat-containing domain protein [Crassisporium funariophilum]